MYRILRSKKGQEALRDLIGDDGWLGDDNSDIETIESEEDEVKTDHGDIDYIAFILDDLKNEDDEDWASISLLVAGNLVVRRKSPFQDVIH